MSRYRVSFFKNLLSADGHQFRCLQQSMVIRRARSADRAIEAAKCRFERCCHLADWRLHADGVELEIDLITSGLTAEADVRELPNGGKRRASMVS